MKSVMKMSLCKKITIQSDDPYHIGEESDSDDDMGLESSDDELDIPNKLEQEPNSDGSASEDDFEKEMEKELEESFQLQCEASSTSASTAANASEEKDQTKTDKDVYDEDYFSSGSEDDDKVGGVPSKSKPRREILTNEELFYDPGMDDEDEKWVTKQRKMNANKAKTSNTGTKTQPTPKSKSKVEKVPTSDALLSCPACMSILCIDCQRHEIYKSQYRAMFVMNCNVINDEVLKYQEQKHKNPGKKSRKQKGKLIPENMERQSSSVDTDCESYHPVKCIECGTEVAVFDSDEIYHFFNVLTSYA